MWWSGIRDAGGGPESACLTGDPGKAELLLQSATKFFIRDPGEVQVTFVKNNNGQVTHINVLFCEGENFKERKSSDKLWLGHKSILVRHSMFYPKCSQQQASEEIRFCSRCGFRLSVIGDLLKTDGAPVTSKAESPLPILVSMIMFFAASLAVGASHLCGTCF